jgi:hypothetical protein
LAAVIPLIPLLVAAIPVVPATIPLLGILLLGILLLGIILAKRLPCNRQARQDHHTRKNRASFHCLSLLFSFSGLPYPGCLHSTKRTSEGL